MLRQKLSSRKFWMAVVSAILVLLNDGLGLNVPKDTVTAFAALILGYLFSEGAADVARALKGGSQDAPRS